MQCKEHQTHPDLDEYVQKSYISVGYHNDPVYTEICSSSKWIMQAIKAISSVNCYQLTSSMTPALGMLSGVQYRYESYIQLEQFVSYRCYCLQSAAYFEWEAWCCWIE